MELVWPSGLREDVSSRLFAAAPLEAGGALLCRVAGQGDAMRFLAVAFEHAAGGEVNNSWEVGLEIDPSFWARVAKSSAREGLAVIPIHTHPGEAHLPAFSRRDRQGELALQPVLERRTSQPSAAVVMGLNFDSVARFDERSDRVLGRCRDVGTGPKDNGVGSFDADLFARHIAAFGAEGQRRLRALTVGVVGASGTGSHVCEQLSRLGVGRLVVVDPDSVELVNLNRIVTAFASDAALHRSKVQVVKRYVKRAGTGCEVEALQGDVRDESVHKRLIPVDALFGCTDTISSRAILNRIAIQHYVPYWDCGTEIASGGHLRAYGRVRAVLAGGPCLFCGGVINPDQLRIELLSPEARHEEVARRYIRDLNDAGAPAVVTLNGVVASLATTSFLRWAVGDKPIEPGTWVYRSYAGDVRREDVHRDPDCPVCSRGARLGRADLEVKL